MRHFCRWCSRPLRFPGAMCIACKVDDDVERQRERRAALIGTQKLDALLIEPIMDDEGDIAMKALRVVQEAAPCPFCGQPWLCAVDLTTDMVQVIHRPPQCPQFTLKSGKDFVDAAKRKVPAS